MSFDFFNEGLKKDSAVQFSKEQDMFLQSKLPFLDPKKSKEIMIGTALQFLKFSGIRSDGIQKILRSCKIQPGTKTLSYDEMKKIFRGVALAQSDIQPSAINIAANIKTKMPVFYDEQSEDQGPTSPPPQSHPSPVQNRQQVVPVNQARHEPLTQQRPNQDHSHQQIAQKPVQDKSNNFFDAPFKPSSPSAQPTSPSQHPPPQPREKESILSTQLKAFESRWNKLKTDGHKIQGGQVKTLCKNLGQRSNLSKAWKLCSHTYSGALTKGQFFVFLQIVSSSHVPEHLTNEMKQCISLLDHPNSQQPKQMRPRPEKVHSNSAMPPPSLPNKMASSNVFQNFGKNESSIQIRGRTKTQQAIGWDHSQKIQNTRIRIEQASKEVASHNQQLGLMKRGQESMNNLLGQVEQFLSNVNKRTVDVKAQIDELKQGQQTLNERLNRVCMAMNQVIVHQNSLIEELANDYSNQNSLNLQRVNFLQNHIAQLNQQLQLKGQAIKKITKPDQAPQQQSTTVQPPQPQPRPPQQQQPPSPRPAPQPDLQRAEETRPEPQEEPHVRKQSTTEIPAQNYPQKAQQEPQEPVQRASLVERPSQKSVNSTDPEYQQRMKIKRAQVFQLIMYITPVGPGEESALVQRISEYSEQELNTVYFNCYQKLRARQQAQQAENEKLTRQRNTKPPEDEFASSNFQGQPQATQDMFQQ